MSLDHGELENRLRDKDALGPCPACGDPEADQLDPTLFELAGHPEGKLALYLVVCPSCGFVQPFTPEVLRAEEEAGS
jgi:hypothetical protein